MTLVFFSLGLFAAFLICSLVLATRRWHIHLSGKREGNACHELHDGEVPRLGGAALFLAGLVSLTFLSNGLDDASARLLWSLWACLSVVAAIGMYEDFMRNLPPLLRYFGTAAAAMMFSIANGGLGIHAVSIAPLDAVLEVQLWSVLFFAFAVAGVTHAFNLIDGQNGLSAGVAGVCYLGLAAVASTTGQASLALLCLALAGANAGFLLHNYPLGRIFLGDCGAYFNGAAIGALAVLVVNGSPSVSPWFPMALLIYPVWETLFTMLRRRRRSESVFKPDVRHLHHLYFARDRAASTPLLRHSSAPRLLLLSAAPALAATLLYTHTAALALITLGFVLSYLILYARLATATPAGTPSRRA